MMDTLLALPMNLTSSSNVNETPSHGSSEAHLPLDDAEARHDHASPVGSLVDTTDAIMIPSRSGAQSR